MRRALAVLTLSGATAAAGLVLAAPVGLLSATYTDPAGGTFSVTSKTLRLA